MIIDHTTAFCCTCGASHPAAVVRDSQRVHLDVACPHGTVRRLISSDADTYCAIRAKSVRVQPRYHGPARTWHYLLEVTQRCNFQCPICYADIGAATHDGDLSCARVAAIGTQIKQRGGKCVMITGGEPTVRDDVPALIDTLVRRSVRVEMATNGYRLGTEAGYAARLRRAGLSRVWLQFDTFDPQVHRAMRGNTFIAEKQRAAEACVHAGLRLSLICTVTSLNHSHTGDVLAYARSLVPRLNIMDFTVAADVGRYDLPASTLVDRETVINTLCNSPCLRGSATPHDFMPMPSFAPWQLNVHPDCSANFFLLTNGAAARALDELLDTHALADALAGNTMAPHWFARNIVPAWYALQAARPGRRTALLKHLRGFATGRGAHSMVIVSLNTFLGADFQDEQRLARCATCHATGDAFISPCLYNRRAAHHPRSRHAVGHS